MSLITLSTNYDKTPETVPTTTPYDGGIGDVKNYLVRERPVGWLEELSKLEDMAAASASPHLIGQDSWQIKMRQINRDTVLPRQVGNEHKTVLEYLLLIVLFPSLFCSSMMKLFVGRRKMFMSCAKSSSGALAVQQRATSASLQ